MDKKMHSYQERLFNYMLYLSYALMVLSILGISEMAPKYLNALDYHLKVYICLFLIWRFNPFNHTTEFTALDKKISFSAGLFILTTTFLREYITSAKSELQTKIDRVLSLPDKKV